MMSVLTVSFALSGTLGWLVLAGSLGIGVLDALATRSHGRSLCHRCADDIPLDGPGEAQRRSMQLAVFHALTSGRVMAAELVVAIGGCMVAVAAFGLIGGLVYGPLLSVTTVPRLVTSRTHARLYPWCPRCHWGRGDDGDPEPSPFVPVPVATVRDR